MDFPKSLFSLEGASILEGYDPSSQTLISLAQKLIQFPSITPAAPPIFNFVEALLRTKGFKVYRLTFEEEGAERVENLFAVWGTGLPHFCFAGHLDVVPAGQEDAWMVQPFSGVISDGKLYGRGASDMKGAIAAFISAFDGFVKERGFFSGQVSLLLTGDEEGVGINGTQKVLSWMQGKGYTPDFCLVGEPTSQERVGDTIKHGRRGSINFGIKVKGKAGHTAYGHLASNPIPILIQCLSCLFSDLPLDEGTDGFPPSSLEVTSIKCENPAPNVIPGEVEVRFNIRFNPCHTSESLTSWVVDKIRLFETEEIKISLEKSCNALPFLTTSLKETELLQQAIVRVTGKSPALSTTGGTSDARFIHSYCPVLELGGMSKTIHKPNEHIALIELITLSKLYHQILKAFFNDLEQTAY